MCLAAQEHAKHLLYGHGTLREPSEAVDTETSETALRTLLAGLTVRAKL